MCPTLIKALIKLKNASLLNKEIIYLTDITNDDNGTLNQEEQEEEDNSEKIILNESNIVDVDVNEILDNSNALVNDMEETRESEENHLVYSG